MELQFTVGEALTNAAVGSRSGAARDVWTCTEDQYCPPDCKYVWERQREEAVRVQTGLNHKRESFSRYLSFGQVKLFVYLPENLKLLATWNEASGI